MTQPARGIAFWLVLLYTVVTAFLFNIAAVRSLFDPEYQWASGYFFRTAHGSFRGLEGFLPALVPAVIGFAVWLYGLRGDRRVFGLGVLIWTVFGALNVGLTGELPTFTGGTLGVHIGAVVFGLIIYGAMALAAFWAIVQLRQGLSGLSFAISPPSRAGWAVLVIALLLHLPIRLLDAHPPLHGLTDQIAVSLTMGQYLLYLVGLSLRRPVRETWHRRTQSVKPSIECTRVRPTVWRPRSAGTYIVRLSPANRRRLKVRDGAYLKVAYGKASVLACLSVDIELDDETILMDQTLRMAIYLHNVVHRSAKREVVFNQDGSGDLEHPIAIQPSNFRGPTLLSRLLKQQYIVCRVHHALATDMEKSIVRMSEDAMEVINIDKRGRVLLIGENRRKSERCLALRREIQLPLETMFRLTPPCPEAESLPLPWITVDRQTRFELAIAPWQPIYVGADVYQLAIREAALPGTLIALMIWLSQFVPETISIGELITITNVPLATVIAGIASGVTFMWLKIRSRL